MTEAPHALKILFLSVFNLSLLRNLYIGREATVKTGRGTTDAEYIMRNAGLDEAQAGIKIAGRNISNTRYADDTTLMAKSEEELKSLLMKVKEESGKSWLKIQHSEN